MIRSYFVIAIRYILRNKIQSIIQVLSLSIGITAVILIGLYANHELSCDKFNKKIDRIYRLEYGDQVGMPTAPGHQVKQQIPEVENVVRMVNWSGKDGSLSMKYIPINDSTDERIIEIEDFFWCDSTIFEVFTFPFVQGDPKTALRDPNTCVISESTARTIFGDRNPVGEPLGQYSITGVIEDVKNSHIEINMLMSIVSLGEHSPYARGDPGYLNNYLHDFSYMTYVLLPDGTDPIYIEGRMNDFFTENIPGNSGFFAEGKSFSLRPLKGIYFAANLNWEKNYCRHGNMKLLRVLMTIAVFILLLAVINYVNLTTALASLRAKEVGIRKAVGSSKPRLISQFLVETILVTVFSLLIALTMVQVLLPGFSELATTDLNLVSKVKPGTWFIYIISVIILGLISGIYPAFYLTRFQPVAFLSGKHVKGSGSVVFRRILMTFQFAISIVLIIGVFVIFRQLNYMKSADLGFNKEWVINLEYDWLGRDPLKRQLLKQQLLKNPNINGVAFSGGLMGGQLLSSTGGLTIRGIHKSCDMYLVDPDFFDVMEIKLLDGRNLSWDRTADYASERGDKPAKIIINETARREFELESPVGLFEKSGDETGFEIIGVVGDFNYESQHKKIEPCYYIWWSWLPTASIKVTPTKIPATLEYIKKEVESLNPEEVAFKFSFLDETYNRQYLRDERTAKIISNFAIVAILIACLGLFGLSSFMAARRTKEIGIRKAMGASVQSVFLLLSREFIKWVILSVVIACPLAWFVMNRWLQSFAYRTNIGVGTFILAIVVAFAIAFITVAWQSLKTARRNPVEALRYE